MRARQSRVVRGRVGAEHRHGAAVAAAVALEDLDRRRLAGAVRAEQREDLALADLEADAAQRLVPAVALAEVLDDDGLAVTARARGRRRRGTPARGRRRSRRRSARSRAGARRSRPSRRGPRRPRARRRRSRRARGARPARASTPTADAIPSAVSRARSSGLEMTASGLILLRTKRRPSSRACCVPCAVRVRRSSGSPGAASAWRTRKRRTPESLEQHEPT